jgi:hypothetical protein
MQPGYWNFTFSTADHRLLGVTEEQSKEMLLSYFHDHAISDESSLGWLTSPSIVATAFSIVGWRREINLQRRASQMR